MREDLRVVSELFANAGDVPTKIAMSQTGIYTPAYGEPREITTARLDEMVRNFNQNAQSTKVSVYYDHWGNRKAAGEVKSVMIDRDASTDKQVLYGEVEWTKNAKEAIKQKEYKYVSVEVVLNYSVLEDMDTQTTKDYGAVLTGVALTNEPAVYDLPSIMYSGSKSFVAKFNKPCSDKQKGDIDMSKELLKKLGVDSEDEAVTLFSSLKEKAESLEKAKLDEKYSKQLKDRDATIAKLTETVEQAKHEAFAKEKSGYLSTLFNNGMITKARHDQVMEFGEEKFSMFKEMSDTFGVSEKQKATPEPLLQTHPVSYTHLTLPTTPYV